MYYFEILEELYKRNVRYLLAGGLSVNLYGIPRVTQDIEMLNKVRKYLEKQNG